jgi:hypothetical protein
MSGRLVTRADRWLLAPAPPTRLAALRILVAAYCTIFLLARFGSFWGSLSLPRRQWEPVGPLWFLGEPLPVGLAQSVVLATVALGVAATLGWRWRLTGPAFALAFLVVATLRMSWGHVIHTENLAVLHLLVIGFSRSAADVWSLDAVHRSGPDARSLPSAPSYRYGLPLRLMAVILVITYVLAGWMKLRNGGADWLTGDVLRNQIAYDNLRKELLGSPHSPIGGWVVQFGWPFHPIAWLTVVVELGAPLALLGGRIRTLWAIAAWGFHVGILVLMAISFPYPLSGVAYACLFRPERIVGPVLDRTRQLVVERRLRSGTMGKWRPSRTS